MQYSSCIINKYINQQFLPHLWEQLRFKQIEKKVQKHMPHVISNNMMIDLLDSAVKNSNLHRKMKKKDQFQQIHQNKKEYEDIKLRIKKNKKIQSTFIKIQHDYHEKADQQMSRKSVKKYNSSIIKLPNTNQEQSQEVRQMRKLKERMRRFQNQIKQRGDKDAQFNQESARKKKSVHSQCKYHTYDYSSNILPVDFENYNDYGSPENVSLLQCLKKNLDKQIQEQILTKKLTQIENRHKNINFKVPSHKIQKIQSNNQRSVNIDKSQQKVTPLKPHFKFQLSSIQSLSKQFQKYIESGVKMVTNQQKIIQQQQNPEGARFVVKKQKLIHKKQSSQKQKTLSSQSIIYSLQKILKDSLIRDNKSQQSNNAAKKYQSLQLNRQQYQSKLSQHQANIEYKQIKSTINTPASYDFKLPQIKLNHKGRRLQKKRTSTQQKMIKGLDHIEIQIKSPHKSQENHHNQRSGLFSAFSAHKQTESSIEQYEFDKLSARGKKQKTFIKDYFNNYGNQFRFKREIMDKLSIKS